MAKYKNARDYRDQEDDFFEETIEKWNNHSLSRRRDQMFKEQRKQGQLRKAAFIEGEEAYD